MEDIFPGSNGLRVKTGIEYVFQTDGSALDLAERAVRSLISKHPNIEKEIDCLIYVSQSQEILLPSSAFLLQNRIGLNKSAMIFDIGQGCSGFVQALLIATLRLITQKNVLIVCADAYRAKIGLNDRATSALFSDAASAILISNKPTISIDSESHFSDGSGAVHLIQRGLGAEDHDLHMSGLDVMLFAKREVPKQVNKVVGRSGIDVNEVKGVYLHQASKIVLDEIAKNLNGLRIAPSMISEVGNTVSSAIPILLERDLLSISDGAIVVCGFGVGLSVATALIKPLT